MTQAIDKLSIEECRKIIIMMYSDLCYASGLLDGIQAPNNYIGDRISSLDEMLFTSYVGVQVTTAASPKPIDFNEHRKNAKGGLND